LAIVAVAPDTPPKPSQPDINETMAKMMAHFSMCFSCDMDRATGWTMSKPSALFNGTGVNAMHGLLACHANPRGWGRQTW
jgi:hypothetical protein